MTSPEIVLQCNLNASVECNLNAMQYNVIQSNLTMWKGSNRGQKTHNMVGTKHNKYMT